MRNPITTVALAAWVAVPLSVSAGGLSPATPQSPKEKTGLSQLAELFQKFGINLTTKAQAQQCRDEGETYTSDEQCCPGLDCIGALQMPVERRTDRAMWQRAPLPTCQRSRW